MATRFTSPALATVAAAAAAASLGALLLLRQHANANAMTKHTITHIHTHAADVSTLPYPPDALPGARDVVSPYGSIRVYEWGPDHGDRILLIHGISTPSIALSDLAHRLVAKGCRVMLFGTNHHYHYHYHSNLSPLYPYSAVVRLTSHPNPCLPCLIYPPHASRTQPAQTHLLTPLRPLWTRLLLGPPTEHPPLRLGPLHLPGPAVPAILAHPLDPVIPLHPHRRTSPPTTHPPS